MNVIELHQCHKGEFCLIIGCGESAYLAQRMPGIPRIAVNDACLVGDCEYQVCVNQIQQYTEKQKSIIKNNKGIAFFTGQQWKDTQTPVFRINLKKDHDYHFYSPTNKLFVPYGKTSIYVALYIAKFLGFIQIGLVGYDFTPNRILPSSSTDLLESDRIHCNNELYNLYMWFSRNGIIIFNLSDVSRIVNIPKADWENFYSHHKVNEKMIEQGE